MLSLRGWPVVLAVTALLSAWALGLRWLAPREALGPTPDELQARERMVQELLERLPVNALERFLQQLDLEPRRLDAYGFLPWDGVDVVVAVGEPGDDQAFWDRALAEVARSGARLVWLPADANAREIRPLGLAFAAGAEATVTARPAHPLPLLRDVSTVSLRRAGRLQQVGSPAVRLLEDERHEVFAVLVPVGRGEVVVVNGPHLAELSDLGAADNGLLLAALSRRGGSAARAGAARPLVGMIRCRETAREQLITALARLERSQRLARRDAPLLTLLSLAAANPSCLVLLQLLLVSLVHLLGAGRELPGPARGAEPLSERAFHEGLTALCRRARWCERVLLPVAANVFRRRLQRALGAPIDAGARDLHGRLERRSPALAARFARLSRDLEAALAATEPTPRPAFLAHLREMDALVAEVRA